MASGYLQQFQSTYLYKVRHEQRNRRSGQNGFQSTYLYKVRRIANAFRSISLSFNPRTYIRYDQRSLTTSKASTMFQSTYLYKVRLDLKYILKMRNRFQSTYLYKVRRSHQSGDDVDLGFNPRTYIRYDQYRNVHGFRRQRFNPRTYIRYDPIGFTMVPAAYMFQSTYLYKVRLHYK